MSDRALIQIGAAARRWHAALVVRQRATREKRLADTIARLAPTFSPERSRQIEADRVLAAVKLKERKAARALAKLCAQYGADDVVDVTPKKANPAQPASRPGSVQNHQVALKDLKP